MESCMREIRTCSLGGGRRPALKSSGAPPPTRLKVKGKCVYLYRAIDKNGNLVDSLLSDKRDMNAARRFFLSAQSVAGRAPERITTDGHPCYPRAIQNVFGKRVVHRDNWYQNRHIERNHREIKQRYNPMLGSSAFPSAQRFWRAFEEIRQYFRPRSKQNQFVSLSKCRNQFVSRVRKLEQMFQAA